MTKYLDIKYFDNGRTLEWGKDLSQEYFEAMSKGEIFTLLDNKGQPFRRIFKDFYGELREHQVYEYSVFEGLIFGIPPSPFLLDQIELEILYREPYRYSS